MSSTQKALVVRELGASEPVALVHDWPIPQPGPNQIQLKVRVAGINPHDSKAATMGLFIKDNLPAVLTNDVVGIVTKLGPDVTGVEVGDRIVAQSGFSASYAQNGLQEYCLADVGAFSKIPSGTTDDEAATLPTSIMAPVVALFKELAIPAPWSPSFTKSNQAATTLLIVGGGANTGRFGVQLARLAGVGRIVVVGGDEAELRGLGATHVLDRHGGDDAVLARVRDVVGDDLVLALDAVNMPEGLLVAANALSGSRRGVLARLVPLGEVDESRVIGKSAGFEVRDVFGSSMAAQEVAGGFWESLGGYLEKGEIKPLKYVAKKGLVPEHVNEALIAYREGKPVVKTNIHVEG